MSEWTKEEWDAAAKALVSRKENVCGVGLQCEVTALREALEMIVDNSAIYAARELLTKIPK